MHNSTNSSNFRQDKNSADSRNSLSLIALAYSRFRLCPDSGLWSGQPDENTREIRKFKSRNME